MNGRVVFPLVLLGGIFYVLIHLTAVLLPFLLAATIAYVLNPFVMFFEMRGIRRNRAVLVIYTTLLVSFIGMAYLGISEAIQSASTVATDLPMYMQGVKGYLLRLAELPLMQRLGVSEWIQTQMVHDMRSWLLEFLQTAPGFIRQRILPIMELSLLVPFLTYFFMMDGQRFLSLLLDFVPSRYVEMLLNILVEINHSMGNYLRGLLLQAFFMGVFTGLCYSIIGLRYAVYIAIWAAMSSMIPFLGPISAATAGAIVAFFQWGTLSGLVKVLVVFMVIRGLDDWFLHPLIIRRAVRIHPVVTFFSLMAGAYLGGLWGLLFAVPAVCMLKVLLEVAWQWYRTEYGVQVHPVPTEASQIPII